MTTLFRLRKLAPPALADQLSPRFWARLARHYVSPPRAYHNLEHVRSVAEWFVAWQGVWQRPYEVFCAVLFHDAVYEVTAADNEARSAVLARDALAHTDVDVSFVATLIYGTALSSTPLPCEHQLGASPEADRALFVDCDRAVLGAAPADYARYARGVAEEYACLPREAYRRGRRAFLERTLAAEALFLTPAMQQRLGPQARKNLAWELSTLAK